MAPTSPTYTTKNHSKDRLTITLRRDLIPLIDNFVDGKKIRNRSHAIEYILGQHLGLGIQTAVILAGADEHGVVNALTRVRNRPVIAYIFETLKAHGVHNVILMIDSLGGKLREYLGNGTQWEMRMKYVTIKRSAGTAQALLAIKNYIEQTFLLMYADVVADLNLRDVVEHHQQLGVMATVALTYKRTAEQYGVARMEGNKIVNFAEKPGKSSRHGLVNAGIYLLEPDVFEYFAKNARSLEQEVLPQVAVSGQLGGYPFEGQWFNISDAADKRRAEREWR